MNNFQKNNLLNVQIIFFDFDGVFTNNKVIIDENGIESVVCDRSDGIGLSRLLSGGVKVYIVSTEENPVVSMRAKKLKIKAYQGVKNKLFLIKQILKEENINSDQAIFVGNDINDIPAMLFVGCSIAPFDAYPEVIKISTIHLNKNGGEGAVREICDMICLAQSIKSKYETF